MKWWKRVTILFLLSFTPSSENIPPPPVVNFGDPALSRPFVLLPPPSDRRRLLHPSPTISFPISISPKKKSKQFPSIWFKTIANFSVDRAGVCWELSRGVLRKNQKDKDGVNPKASFPCLWKSLLLLSCIARQITPSRQTIQEAARRDFSSLSGNLLVQFSIFFYFYFIFFHFGWAMKIST